MKRLLTIETINNPAGASEGRAIEQCLKLMLDYMNQRTARHLKIDPCQQAYTRSKFLKLLKEDVDYLHISAHGKRSALEIGRKEKRGKIIQKGTDITPDEIRDAGVKAKYVFVSACSSGHEDLAEAFFSDRRKGIYLGPCKKIDFEKALLVALNFYRGLFLENSLRKGINYVARDRSIGPSTYYYFESPRDF